MRVLTWNLFHGRAQPGAGRDLRDAFAQRIAGWDWDVALLQEVPPWWPPHLAAAASAEQRTVLTARNQLLCLTRPLAQRWPDIIKSWGGGANTILVRPSLGLGAIAEHRSRRLRIVPERRYVHAVRMGGGGPWLANLHAQVRPHSETRKDLALAAATVLRWASGGPAVLGGDTNVPDPEVEGFAMAGGHSVDRILVRGLEPAGRATTPERGSLSDHAPVLLDLRPS